VTAFLDSSALVKRYAAEEHSKLVTSLDEVVVASEIALVEVPAALWRKHRLGELPAADARVLTTAFRRDCSGADPDIQLVQVSPYLLQQAANLVARHPLRAYDAVQLASALLVRQELGACTFGCFDKVLLESAAAEHMASTWRH